MSKELEQEKQDYIDMVNRELMPLKIIYEQMETIKFDYSPYSSVEIKDVLARLWPLLENSHPVQTLSL